MTRHVRIVEVGPRDGLQNESQPVSTAHKVELINPQPVTKPNGTPTTRLSIVAKITTCSAA